MIKKLFLALSLLSFIPCMADSKDSDFEYVITADLRVKPQSSYGLIKTVVTGSAIGAATGWAAYASDKLFPINWLILRFIRNKLNDEVIEHARDQNKKINGDLIDNISWISDWITYLALPSNI